LLRQLNGLRHYIPPALSDGVRRRLPAAAAERTVTTDNALAGYVAARHLIELGHKLTAMLVGDFGLSPPRDRLEGFRKQKPPLPDEL
jgi:DNA-binding LacI/PurR family transcriptional regulator